MELLHAIHTALTFASSIEAGVSTMLVYECLSNFLLTFYFGVFRRIDSLALVKILKSYKNERQISSRYDLLTLFSPGVNI